MEMPGGHSKGRQGQTAVPALSLYKQGEEDIAYTLLSFAPGICGIILIIGKNTQIYTCDLSSIDL